MLVVCACKSHVFKVANDKVYPCENGWFERATDKIVFDTLICISCHCHFKVTYAFRFVKNEVYLQAPSFNNKKTNYTIAHKANRASKCSKPKSK